MRPMGHLKPWGFFLRSVRGWILIFLVLRHPFPGTPLPPKNLASHFGFLSQASLGSKSWLSHLPSLSGAWWPAPFLVGMVLDGRHLAAKGEQGEECHTRTQYSSFHSLYFPCALSPVYMLWHTQLVRMEDRQANTLVTNRVTRNFLAQGGRKDSMGGVLAFSAEVPRHCWAKLLQSKPNTFQILQEIKKTIPNTLPAHSNSPKEIN